VVERRKKTHIGDNNGKGAARKNPRRGKAPPARSSHGHPDPQRDGSVEGQDLREPAPAQDSSSEGPRIALPGVFYLRADRWWWRVKLLGEDKAKARPLERNGAKAAADDRETAGKIAFEMWERAVRENAVRQITLESTEKIERLKAQFLDKVRHFTELVETANARIETETKARTEAEARLAQGAQRPEPGVPDKGPKTEDKGPPAPQSAVPAGEIESTTPPALNPPVEVGACECCGATGVALADLKRIDSGQLLCPRCLAALRADVVRIESAPAE